MIKLQPDLIPGETILRDTRTTIYRVRGRWSAAGPNVKLWLTDRRLLTKAGIGPQRAWPLSALTRVSEQKASLYNMLHLEFGGEHLWPTVLNQPESIQALEQARARVPVLPYEPAPERDPSRVTLALVLVVVAMGIGVVCILESFFLATRLHHQSDTPGIMVKAPWPVSRSFQGQGAFLQR